MLSVDSAICFYNSDDSTQVLHLLAMARSADIELTIDDFQTVADRTPYLADLRFASNMNHECDANNPSTDRLENT